MTLTASPDVLSRTNNHLVIGYYKVLTLQINTNTYNTSVSYSLILRPTFPTVISLGTRLLVYANLLLLFLTMSSLDKQSNLLDYIFYNA